MLLRVSILFFITRFIFAQDMMHQQNRMYSGDIRHDKELQKKAIDLLKEAIKSSKTTKKVSPEKSMMIETSEVCVNCENALDLTDSVNEILKHLPSVKNKGSEASLEFDQLVAVTEYTRFVTKTNKVECVKSEELDVPQEFVEFNQNDLKLVFSNDVDAQNFLGASVSRNFYKEVYLRGTGEDVDKIVKVVIPEKGDVKIEYYELSNISEEDIELINAKYNKERILKESLPQLNNPELMKRAQKNRSSGIFDYTLDLTTKSDDFSISGHIGPKVVYEDYLPKSISLIEFNSNYDMSDSFKLKSSIEINHKKQRANVELTDEAGDTLSYIKVSNSGNVRVGLPYHTENFRSGDSFGFKALAEYQTKKDKVNISTDLSLGKAILLRASYTQDDDGKAYSIGNEYEFDNGAFLSVKYRSLRKNNSSARDNHNISNDFEDLASEDYFWVSYIQKF